jgi:acyl carrier protein phosphodiesterase
MSAMIPQVDSFLVGWPAYWTMADTYMNFLAHLVLAGDDDGLRLGAVLGDFVRGRRALDTYPGDVRLGIELHRHTDQFFDSLPDVANLRKYFPATFRRYSGIMIDLAYDHELANRWENYSSQSLEDFDREIHELLARNDRLLPDRLRRFMSYAGRRGLFAAYREKSEIMYSLRGIGSRLSRPNPLHRAEEIWDELAPRFSASFEHVFLQVQSDVPGWLKSRSTTTGS